MPTDEEEEPPKDVGSEQTKVKSASQSEVEAGVTRAATEPHVC